MANRTPRADVKMQYGRRSGFGYGLPWDVRVPSSHLGYREAHAMGDSRNAQAFVTRRLRNEAGELLERTKHEPGPEVRHEMAQRADLLDRTAEMLDVAAE